MATLFFCIISSFAKDAQAALIKTYRSRNTYYGDSVNKISLFYMAIYKQIKCKKQDFKLSENRVKATTLG